MCLTQNKRKPNKSGLRLFLSLCALALVSTSLPAQEPSLYGRVTLDRFSSKAGLGPVTFDHWLHRAMFTCRLCHVDVGFAMQANASGVNARSNREGYFCGACHNGKTPFAGRVIFSACADSAPNEQCARCHTRDKTTRRYDYDTFTAKFPKNAYGIDWEEAESINLIKPIDTIEGISIKKPALKGQEDFSIQPRVVWVSDIIFSHKKHTVWNGCEVCHPEIFPATQKGVVRYTMFHISRGQYCGVCHGKVAFPTNACGNCHKNMENKEVLKDVVVMAGPARASGFGSVKFMHKTHVGDYSVKCEVCHHPPKDHRTSKESSERATTEQLCSNCHTHRPEQPVTTPLQGAFHNINATSGVCIDCHKQENAKNLNNDIDFARSILPQNQVTIDKAQAQLTYGKNPEMRQLAQEIITDRRSEMEQMQLWLKEHNSDSWAPVKCRECHKKVNNIN